ncbi:MAG: hypothetical protein K6E29_00365 [Cyanobacteria bacterium RUI128]|nr:hypothetical protein [Cyanobacteria bacterium RUI128]
MNIFQTFELFLRKPLSILKNGLVSIVHIKAENMFEKKAVNVDLLKNKAQITVVNNEKVYKLLKLVTYRAATKKIPVETKIKSETLLEINK